MSYTLSEVAKAVVAFVLAVVTAFGTAAADGSVELAEVAGVLGAIVTAYGVYKAKNAPTA